MSVDSVLEAAQRRALGRMTSRATVRRPLGTTPGPDGFDVTQWQDVVVDVPFRLIRGTGYRTIKIGETEQQVAAHDGDFPVGTPLRDRDLVDITSGECAGRVVRVLESMPSDQRKSLRVPVVEDQRPAEWV